MSENAESLVSAPVCFGPRTDKDDAKPIISNKNHTKHEDMVKSLTLLSRHTVLELLSGYDLGASLCQAKRVSWLTDRREWPFSDQLPRYISTQHHQYLAIQYPTKNKV